MYTVRRHHSSANHKQTTNKTGSYLEDQDHWRLSGLERDVELAYVEGLGPAGHVIRDYTCVVVFVWVMAFCAYVCG